ncbi:hypothetical protein [Streptomyces shenzhenensis]|uniref:hypothetical protein n=1 Tax=Streptomyces shenzhenensis TaxID=943815 RepID=UPI001F2924EC|nr:hypothetical protein [Streptomyces shenzhenensis]
MSDVPQRNPAVYRLLPSLSDYETLRLDGADQSRNPAKAWATTWRRDGASAWVRGNAPVEVRRALRRGSGRTPDGRLAADIGSPRITAPGARPGSGGGEDFVGHRSWIIADKVVLAGVKHDDSDAPVQLVVVLREDAPDADEGDDGNDDWS